MPAKHWARLDLSACRVGWDAGREYQASLVSAVQHAEWANESSKLSGEFPPAIAHVGPAALSPEHVCGLQGYNPMIDPPCPGCEARHSLQPNAPHTPRVGIGEEGVE
jgi:hypothetical protein